MYTRALIAVMMILAASLGPAYADEVTDTIREALKEYRKGAYRSATETLEYASQLIMQKRAGRLRSLLPAPLPGWSAEDAESQAIGPAMAGVKVGIFASRRYRKDSGSVTVTISTDIPLLKMQMFNPMLGAPPNARMRRIKGQKAFAEYSPKDKSGKLSIVAAERFFITVEGDGVPEDVLEAYAERIDYKRLSALP